MLMIPAFQMRRSYDCKGQGICKGFAIGPAIWIWKMAVTHKIFNEFDHRSFKKLFPSAMQMLNFKCRQWWCREVYEECIQLTQITLV